MRQLTVSALRVVVVVVVVGGSQEGESLGRPSRSGSSQLVVEAVSVAVVVDQVVVDYVEVVLVLVDLVLLVILIKCQCDSCEYQ